MNFLFTSADSDFDLTGVAGIHSDLIRLRNGMRLLMNSQKLAIIRWFDWLKISGRRVFAKFRFFRRTDDRLIGTWQSDADRTIAWLVERKPVDQELDPTFVRIFGKLQITYTRSTITLDLEDWVVVYDYQVVASDRHSVVIREIGGAAEHLAEYIELSEFTVIQFEGPDLYWVTTSIGGVREYFERVR